MCTVFFAGLGNLLLLSLFLMRILIALYLEQNVLLSGPDNFTKAQAVMMIQNLSVEERKMFLKELKKTVATRDRFLKPSGADLRQLAYHNSLPFVGFGFLDNFIMIIAGEYIDLTLGKNNLSLKLLK